MDGQESWERYEKYQIRTAMSLDKTNKWITSRICMYDELITVSDLLEISL